MIAAAPWIIGALLVGSTTIAVIVIFECAVDGLRVWRKTASDLRALRQK